jgi:transcriptional regulator with XRE-family HTH domain
MPIDSGQSFEIRSIDTSPAKTFGKRIRQLRKPKHITHRSVSEVLDASLKKEGHRGLDATYLSKIENEKLPPPSPPVILALASVLQANPKELLTLAGKTVPGLEGKLLGRPAARKFVEFAIDQLSEREWKRLLAQIQKREKKK